MKFSVNKNELSTAVGKLSRAVANKSSLPVLEGILFSAEDGRITMAAYNYEIGMKKELEADCEDPGDIVIGAKLLLEIIRKMPEDTVTVEVGTNCVCHITSGSSSFDIVGQPAEEFPEIPSAAGGKELKMPGSMLKSMVRQTIFAVDEENATPMYTGIYFEIESDYIKLVALDGLRIALRTETAKNETPMKFVITGRSLSEVFRMIEDESETIAMSVSQNHMSFETDGYYLVSRLIEGNYLDYQTVIKKEEKIKLRLNANEINDIIERISLIINNPRNTPVRCTIEKGEMKFTCATTIGRASDVAQIDYDGPKLEFGFNARFMTDALKATETDEINMIFNGDIAPIMIKPTAGDNFLYVVMPMRIRNG